MDQSNSYQLGPNWYGEKVVIQDNGLNLYFNQNNDTIAIQTQAGLNDTFLIYTYPNGNYIKGWVSALDEEVHLGQVDSVKTISLFTNSLNYQINVTALKIGKTLGLITVFPFYSFPEVYLSLPSINNPAISNPLLLSGSEFPKIGITRMTKGDIYDYDIGDIINHKQSTFLPQVAGGVTETFITNLKVINKVSWGSDSVRYTFEKKTSHHYFDSFTESFQLILSPLIIEDQLYTDLDTYFSKTLPHEALLDTNNFSTALVSSLAVSEDCENPLVETLHDLDFAFDPSTGAIDCILCNPKQFEYFAKAGGPYASGLDGPSTSSFNSVIIYRMNSFGSCGDEWYLNTENINFDRPTLSVFPNPFRHNMILKAKIKQNENLDLNIYNSKGQVVYRSVISASELNNGHHLSPQNLVNGQYFLEVIGENIFTRTLIIKQ